MTRPKTEEIVRATVRLPKSLWDRAAVHAIQKNTTLQKLVEDALEAHLRKAGRP